MFTFWCILQNGNHNSVSAGNIFEAQRRARALDAKKLFAFDSAKKKSAELAF